jgi:hypothetical protein
MLPIGLRYIASALGKQTHSNIHKLYYTTLMENDTHGMIFWVITASDGYQTTRYHDPEDHKLNLHRRENLIPYIRKIIFLSFVVLFRDY